MTSLQSGGLLRDAACSADRGKNQGNQVANNTIKLHLMLERLEPRLGGEIPAEFTSSNHRRGL